MIAHSLASTTLSHCCSFSRIFQANCVLCCSWKMLVGLCVLCSLVLCQNSIWHSRPSSNGFSSIRLNFPFFPFSCFITFSDTTLCLIKQRSDHIHVTKNQTTIDSSKKDIWKGLQIKEVYQNTHAKLWTKTLGWVRRNGIERKIRAMTNEYKCLQEERLLRLFKVSSLVIEWTNQERKTEETVWREKMKSSVLCCSWSAYGISNIHI